MGMDEYQFLNFLLSKCNSANKNHISSTKQNMNLPLNHYYIASSHNTYLTGDQITSKSSTDMYRKALKMGCKCVELDIWDGPDGEPVIYHGHTLTSRIKFYDAIVAINECAFDVSPYPVVLSFENHCCISQQDRMAAILKEVFGNKLEITGFSKRVNYKNKK